MKTIEEAAEEYAGRYQGIRRNEAFDAFNAGADFALANQWVSIEERLPEHGVLVLVVDEDGDIHEARYNTQSCEWVREYRNTIAFFDGFITHWMPIPELNTIEK